MINEPMIECFWQRCNKCGEGWYTPIKNALFSTCPNCGSEDIIYAGCPDCEIPLTVEISKEEWERDKVVPMPLRVPKPSCCMGHGLN